jgi:UDP-N-acetylmuramoyl-tripeptide--D-alanyl-D-alanine ligase
MTVQFTWAELSMITGGRWSAEVSGTLPGVSSVSTDTRKIGPGDMFLCLKGERFDGHDFADTAIEAGAAAVCCSEARPDTLAAAAAAGAAMLIVDDTLAAFQDLGRAHRRRFSDIPVIAITGSSGKTSTKEMTAAVLAAGRNGDVLATIGNTNNLIGVPQNLLRLTGDHVAAVLELGTNAPGEIGTLVRIVEPTCAVLTSVGAGHLEGLGSVDGVAREKSAIFSTLGGAGAAVLPQELAENPIVASALPANATTVGGTNASIAIDYDGGGLEGSSFRVTIAGAEFQVDWSITGAHQAANAGLAIGAAQAAGISIDTAVAALSACTLPGMRMKVMEAHGCRWVNDAYNANPDSARALVDWLGGISLESLVLVLGDMLELGPTGPQLHRELLEHARAVLPKARIVAVGPLMSAAADGLADDCFADSTTAREPVRRLATPSTVIALKGSRGMRLEKILE